MKGYCHYCPSCRTYYQCTDTDPEKKLASCPVCKTTCKLGFRTLEETKKQIGLSASEIGKGNVTYRNVR